MQAHRQGRLCRWRSEHRDRRARQGGGGQVRSRRWRRAALPRGEAAKTRAASRLGALPRSHPARWHPCRKAALHRSCTPRRGASHLSPPASHLLPPTASQVRGQGDVRGGRSLKGDRQTRQEQGSRVHANPYPDPNPDPNPDPDPNSHPDPDPDPNPKQAIEFTGKGSYSFGDVSIELNKRRAEWITGYLGKEYEFGDLTTKMVRDFTGNTDYKFGDITKTAVSKFTGKDEYEFGDVSKKLGQMLFGNKQALMYVSLLANPRRCPLTYLLPIYVLPVYLLPIYLGTSRSRRRRSRRRRTSERARITRCQARRFWFPRVFKNSPPKIS